MAISSATATAGRSWNGLLEIGFAHQLQRNGHPRLATMWGEKYPCMPIHAARYGSRSTRSRAGSVSSDQPGLRANFCKPWVIRLELIRRLSPCDGGASVVAGDKSQT